MITILPDYLFRRYVQDKRIGREINIYTVWYELRWGIVTCLLLTISLITVVFYYHPATKSAATLFRTVTILPESGGRVTDVFVTNGETVAAGQKIFQLDDSEELAAVETASKRINEVDASIEVARADLEASVANVAAAKSEYLQAVDEYNTRSELADVEVVARREVERLKNLVDARQAGVDAATANQRAIQTKITTFLPAEKASAEAALDQARAELAKKAVYAGVAGKVEQFVLRPGDFVSPVLRPAGLLIPTEAGRQYVLAGFEQISAQEVKIGMIAEAVCVSKPFSVIPLIVTDIQDYIATGQFRPTDQLLEPDQLSQPGTVLAFLEPLFEGGLSAVPPGSSCIVNAYTNNYERLHTEQMGTLKWIALHVVDTVGLVHAIILRIQALLLPFQTLVFGGH